MKKLVFHIVLLIFTSGIFFFLNLGRTPLMEPDEGRNAEVAREILATGDWATPHLDFVRKLNKPILLYWASALSMKLFGVNEFAARFPLAVAALAGVIAVYFLGRRLFGDRSGLLSAVILATSPIYIAFSRLVIFDMMLTAFITLAMLFFSLGFTEREPGRKRVFYLLFYAAAALAVLTKGPIGAAIPAAVIGLYLLLTGSLGRIREMEVLRGPLLFLAVAAPWYVLISLRNPEFPRYFFITEHVVRYTTEHFHRVKPFWYYIPVVIAGFLPWIFFLPSTIVTSLKKNHHDGSGKKKEMLFLALWAGFIFVLFTFSRAKQPGYVLPLFPALALITATSWDDYLRRNNVYPFVIFCAVAMLIFAGGLLAMNKIAPLRTSKVFAERVLAERRPGDAVVTYETFPSSFLFYLGERVPIVTDGTKILGSSFIEDAGRVSGSEETLSLMKHGTFRALLSDPKKRIYILCHKNDSSSLISEAGPGSARMRLLREGRTTALWVWEESLQE